jgi:hypothetical protein
MTGDRQGFHAESMLTGTLRQERVMRQTISGVLAAFAVVTASTVPAMACGWYGCSPCGLGYVNPCVASPVYVSPAPAFGYSDCYTGCGGWAYERLPDPVHQYYYVNQGPTYSGPGNFAPYPTYSESAVSAWAGYRVRPARVHRERVLRRYY